MLSLDGGGSWAVLQAMALKELYRDAPGGSICRNILKDFDLVIANSGGSLMLAAMCEHADKDIDVVINQFSDSVMRRLVFSKLGFWEKGVFNQLVNLLGIGPKYKASRKVEGFLKALPVTGKMNLSEVPGHIGLPGLHIVICGYDYDRNRAVFLRSHQDVPCTYRLADAINASSNAPVNYFDEPVIFNYNGKERRFWDGAVGGNNNPVLYGLTEAFGRLQYKMEDMAVLSIGTSNTVLPLPGYTITDQVEDSRLLEKMEKPKFANDIKKMASSILSEPPDAANYVSHIFLGGNYQVGSAPAFVRLNPLLQPYLQKNGNDRKWIIPPGISSSDDRKTFFDLTQLDMDAVEDEEVIKVKKLGEWWVKNIIYNQPIYMGSDELDCKIGHRLFSDAKAAWRAL